MTLRVRLPTTVWKTSSKAHARALNSTAVDSGHVFDLKSPADAVV